MDLAAIGVSREIRNDEDAKGRTNHPAIFKQSYTHHYSIQRLVQLSPPPMPSSSQANVMSAPFDRIQKIRFVQGATMGKGIVAVLRQRPREKFRFVSGSGFFHGRVAHPCARACACVWTYMHRARWACRARQIAFRCMPEWFRMEWKQSPEETRGMEEP